LRALRGLRGTIPQRPATTPCFEFSVLGPCLKCVVHVTQVFKAVAYVALPHLLGRLCDRPGIGKLKLLDKATKAFVLVAEVLNVIGHARC
jgi:hypothetical protein